MKVCLNLITEILDDSLLFTNAVVFWLLYTDFKAKTFIAHLSMPYMI